MCSCPSPQRHANENTATARLRMHKAAKPLYHRAVAALPTYKLAVNDLALRRTATKAAVGYGYKIHVQSSPVHHQTESQSPFLQQTTSYQLDTHPKSLKKHSQAFSVTCWLHQSNMKIFNIIIMLALGTVAYGMCICPGGNTPTFKPSHNLEYQANSSWEQFRRFSRP